MKDSLNTLHLTLYEKNKAPTSLSFTDERITIGRATSCKIPLSDGYLSRQHADIRRMNGEWFLSDSGSANGTSLNGTDVTEPVRIKPNDRITLGDTELLVVHGYPEEEDTLVVTPHDAPTAAGLAISVMDLETAVKDVDQSAERLNILNHLATELLEDRPMDELFEFIVDEVMHLLTPSRVALGILAPDRQSFSDVKLKTSSNTDSDELTISQTLLKDVVENRQVLAYTDVAESTDLRRAKSIMGQGIRSALCAPLIVMDNVMGVLYMDYVITKRSITPDDAKLAAKVAQIAARKLETTILREQSLAKQKMDEEMNTAFLIQSRLLPDGPPTVEGFRLAGHNRPSNTVGGDYYDFVVRPDGRVYFIIADVSGKGITAALVMAGVAAAFNTLTNHDPSPAEILSDLNQTLVRKTPASMFVTAFCGLLDPGTAEVVFSCAGHNPPFVIGTYGKVKQLEVRPGLVLGFLPEFEFVDEKKTLVHGSTLYMYTDGITEAMNSSGEIFTDQKLVDVLAAASQRDAREISRASIEAVDLFAGGAEQADDMTLICIQRIGADGTPLGDDTLQIGPPPTMPG